MMWHMACKTRYPKSCKNIDLYTFSYFLSHFLKAKRLQQLYPKSFLVIKHSTVMEFPGLSYFNMFKGHFSHLYF